MRLRHDPAAAPFVAAHERVLLENDAPAFRGKWRSLFGRDSDAILALEIGIGRGSFILNSCRAEPDVCFLGLELRAEMVMQAIERVKQLPPNLYLLQLNAQLIAELFAPEELDAIYINFPDPWPKTKHAKRRLTSPDFIQLYKQVLRSSGEIRFKTEKDSGVLTEYERRFRRKGQPIYYACAVNVGSTAQ